MLKVLGCCCCRSSTYSYLGSLLYVNCVKKRNGLLLSRASRTRRLRSGPFDFGSRGVLIVIYSNDMHSGLFIFFVWIFLGLLGPHFSSQFDLSRSLVDDLLPFSSSSFGQRCFNGPHDFFLVLASRGRRVGHIPWRCWYYRARFCNFKIHLVLNYR